MKTPPSADGPSSGGAGSRRLPPASSIAARRAAALRRQRGPPPAGKTGAGSEPRGCGVLLFDQEDEGEAAGLPFAGALRGGAEEGGAILVPGGRARGRCRYGFAPLAHAGPPGLSQKRFVRVGLERVEALLAAVVVFQEGPIQGEARPEVIGIRRCREGGLDRDLVRAQQVEHVLVEGLHLLRATARDEVGDLRVAPTRP